MAEAPPQVVQKVEDNKSCGNCEVCSQPTESKCSACRLVYYCSLDHQKENWAMHKQKCRAFEVAQNQELGRYLKASRDLLPGDIVFSELPLVFGPKPHRIEEGPFPCVGCCRLLNQTNWSQCTECLWPACSRDCKGLKDPSRHELECRILKLRPPAPITESFYQYFRFDILIVLRALFLQKTNKSKWEHMMKLEDHLDKRGPDSEIFKTIEEKIKHLEDNYLKPLKTYEEETGKIVFGNVSEDLIHKIYAILDVNATELTEDFEAEILYPTASLIEHNCTPNTCQIIEDASHGYRITFRAALPIPKSEHITSIYTHILWGTHSRREHLKQTKYFSCTCQRCKDPSELGTYLSALKCLGTETDPCGGTQLPQNPTDEKVRWVCSKCKIKLPDREIMRFVDHLGTEVDKVLSKQPTVQDLEDMLGKLQNFLHPNHYHMYAVKHSLVQLYGTKATNGVELSEDLLEEKITMCQDLIGMTKRIDPGNARLSLYMGVLLHELFDAKFTLLNRRFTSDRKQDFLAEMKDIAQIVKENKKVLIYEIKSTNGSKLFEVVCQNGLKFQNWLKDNGLMESVYQ